MDESRGVARQESGNNGRGRRGVEKKRPAQKKQKSSGPGASGGKGKPSPGKKRKTKKAIKLCSKVRKKDRRVRENERVKESKK